VPLNALDRRFFYILGKFEKIQESLNSSVPVTEFIEVWIADVNKKKQIRSSDLIYPGDRQSLIDVKVDRK
jgi:hypothetical protein